jgi:hypothetical protein
VSVNEGVLAEMVPQLGVLLPELDEKSRRLVLAAELRGLGHGCGRSTVHRLLRELGFSTRANVKAKEGRAQHADRDAQFRYI